ncbi:MAG: hypothetical protein ACK4Z8_04115 [Novosphingobium sp.]
MQGDGRRDSIRALRQGGNQPRSAGLSVCTVTREIGQCGFDRGEHVIEPCRNGSLIDEPIRPMADNANAKSQRRYRSIAVQYQRHGHASPPIERFWSAMICLSVRDVSGGDTEASKAQFMIATKYVLQKSCANEDNVA